MLQVCQFWFQVSSVSFYFYSLLEKLDHINHKHFSIKCIYHMSRCYLQQKSFSDVTVMNSELPGTLMNNKVESRDLCTIRFNQQLPVHCLWEQTFLKKLNRQAVKHMGKRSETVKRISASLQYFIKLRCIWVIDARLLISEQGTGCKHSWTLQMIIPRWDSRYKIRCDSEHKSSKSKRSQRNVWLQSAGVKWKQHPPRNTNVY